MDDEFQKNWFDSKKCNSQVITKFPTKIYNQQNIIFHIAFSYSFVSLILYYNKPSSVPQNNDINNLYNPP